MDFENIYHVVTLSIGSESEVNALLKSGWKLLNVIQRSELDLSAGHPLQYGQFLVGCSKEIYEQYELKESDSTEHFSF
ncbi:hypothetical protein KZ537_002592 [Enterococcus faecalis]|nr:hypothetical protein [Enterococcus faecalis]EIA7730144.1 hypothetical protein [Enterococcus faecalis]